MPTKETFYRRLTVPLALLSVVAVDLPIQAAALPQPSPSFAATAFNDLWTRTDSLVAAGDAKRSWFWGPQPNTAGLMEPYAEGAGGQRLVQYFDKSRMEINNPDADPSSPFFVTNGLLTVELISGRMQTGNNSFVTRQPSQTNVTGDPGDPLSPTYADLAGVSNAISPKRDPDRTGQHATSTLSHDGKIGNDPSRASLQATTIEYYEPTTGHNIPEAMWTFLNDTGPVKEDGQITESRLANPWFYATGLPISDAYWVKATIAGKPTDVLLQAYERRVLTYVPTNPDGFKVEMGNIGQHYYDWRYNQTPTPSGPATISRYAVDSNGDTSAATLDKMKAIGAGAVRLHVSWKNIEPRDVAPAQYYWVGTDAVFKALSDRGLQPIALIEDCPVWACTRPTGPVREEQSADFVEFMSAMAARYSRAPYNAHFWEFWNEPDSIGDPVPNSPKRYSWGTNGDRYAAMLKSIRPGMKAADPQAMLVLGGLAYDNFQEDGGVFNRHFLDDVLAAGGGQALDALNFHYYPNNVNWCSYTYKLREIRDIEKARGLNLPILSTETGLGSDPALGSSTDTQSLYVVQAYAQSAGEGMLTTAWFLARDFSASGSPFQKYGLLDLSGTAKPAATAYRMASSNIGDRPAIRALGEDDGVSGTMRGYEFGADSRHDNKLWVAWAWDQNTSGACGTPPGTTSFIIPADKAGKLTQVLDMYGQAVNAHSRPDGTLVLSLTARPLYIEWEK